MFKTIVVALDGSAGSRAALPIAAELAGREGARLIVAHVQEMVIGKGGGPVNLAEDEIQDEIRRAARTLEEVGRKVELQLAHMWSERAVTRPWPACYSAVSRSDCSTSPADRSS